MRHWIMAPLLLPLAAGMLNLLLLGLADSDALAGRVHDSVVLSESISK